MATYKEIIEKLLGIFEGLVDSGAMPDEEVKELSKIAMEYYTILQSEWDE